MKGPLQASGHRMRDVRLPTAEAELHGLLQDPTRVSILHALGSEPATAEELSRSLGISLGEAIDHVQALWHGGLVSVGPGRTYRLTAGFEAPLQAIRLYLLRRTDVKK